MIVMAENSVRGKRSNADQHDEDDAASLKPLRKIRAVSVYNLWHAGYMKTPGTIFIVILPFDYIHIISCYFTIIGRS